MACSPPHHLFLVTGTPPRLDGTTIVYDKLQATTGDHPPEPFSFMNDDVWIKVQREGERMLSH